jgi:hypothetical protein
MHTSLTCQVLHTSHSRLLQDARTHIATFSPRLSYTFSVATPNTSTTGKYTAELPRMDLCKYTHTLSRPCQDLCRTASQQVHSRSRKACGLGRQAPHKCHASNTDTPHHSAVSILLPQGTCLSYGRPPYNHATAINAMNPGKNWASSHKTGARAAGHTGRPGPGPSGALIEVSGVWAQHPGRRMSPTSLSGTLCCTLLILTRHAVCTHLYVVTPLQATRRPFNQAALLPLHTAVSHAPPSSKHPQCLVQCPCATVYDQPQCW